MDDYTPNNDYIVTDDNLGVHEQQNNVDFSSDSEPNESSGSLSFWGRIKEFFSKVREFFTPGFKIDKHVTLEELDRHEKNQAAAERGAQKYNEIIKAKEENSFRINVLNELLDKNLEEINVTEQRFENINIDKVKDLSNKDYAEKEALIDRKYKDSENLKNLIIQNKNKVAEYLEKTKEDINKKYSKDFDKLNDINRALDNQIQNFKGQSIKDADLLSQNTFDLRTVMVKLAVNYPDLIELSKLEDAFTSKENEAYEELDALYDNLKSYNQIVHDIEELKSGNKDKKEYEECLSSLKEIKSSIKDAEKNFEYFAHANADNFFIYDKDNLVHVENKLIIAKELLSNLEEYVGVKEKPGLESKVAEVSQATEQEKSNSLHKYGENIPADIAKRFDNAEKIAEILKEKGINLDELDSSQKLKEMRLAVKEIMDNKEGNKDIPLIVQQCEGAVRVGFGKLKDVYYNDMPLSIVTFEKYKEENEKSDSPVANFINNKIREMEENHIGD